MLTGNRGEWSEIYVFLKLLAEGKLHAADADLNADPDAYYPVIRIVRSGNGWTRHYCRNGDVVMNDGENGTTLKRVSVAEFLKQSTELLGVIERAKGSFPIPSIEAFLRTIDVSSLAASSLDKADIKITVHDQRTNKNPELGFSIKSMLGKNSTLFNAGQTTNFVYEIVGDSTASLDLEKINAIVDEPMIASRLEFIRSVGCKLEFDRVESTTLQSNLRLIDGDLPRILADLLKLKYSSFSPLGLPELTSMLASLNPLAFDLSQGHPMYEHKVKNFLTDSALGMTPSKVWCGSYSATGGMIIVKQDGEVVCYHIYNRREFQEYLFRNSKLEQASTSRYGFGTLYRDAGKVFIKLNLQVRFK